jgi:hypothetical protein
MHLIGVSLAAMRNTLPAACLVLVLVPLVATGADPALDSIALPVAQIESRLLGPLAVLGSEQARPKIEGDRSARVQLAGAEGEPPLSAKWKPVAPPGQGFNNEPRYELAAYQFQKLFLDECEYVVPPIVLRALPLEEYRQERPDGQETLRGTDSALFLLSYWLENVTNRDPWDPDRFRSDPRYARHWGNLNILTHLIDHKDGNIGNLLISENPDDPRVFAVDNDVAFRSEVSDRGDPWASLQVDRLPAATLERLRRITLDDLERALGVLAEFSIENGVLLAAEPGENLQPRAGVRRKEDRVQFGLTTLEIRTLKRRIDRLLMLAGRGRITAVDDTAEAIGRACRAAAG